MLGRGLGLTARTASRPLLAGAVVVIALGVCFRLYTPSALWLDEAISVDIARLPLARLPEALRHDGAPPLYYLLLHGWVRLFGTGGVAVRSLSGLLSVLTLPLMWATARRLGGPALTVVATIVLASSPFAIYFATEARMYSLAMLLAVLGALAVLRTLHRPTIGNAVLVALCSAGLLLTHYWSAFLLATTAGWLLWRSLRPDTRRASVVTLGGLAAGLVLFVPWLPTFLFQMRHTGTPWGIPPSIVTGVQALAQWSADAQAVSFADRADPGLVFSRLLELCLVALVGLAFFGRPLDDVRRVELDLLGRPVARELAILCFGSITLGMLVSAVMHAGFQPRYTAPMFVLLPLLAGLGVFALPQRVRSPMVVAVAVLGLVASSTVLTNQRKTQAGRIASAVRAGAVAGDVVVYCPDQLAPAVSRLLPPDLVQLPFPTGRDPSRVDWVDYAKRNRRASVPEFAAKVQAAAGGHTMWVVARDGYTTFDGACSALTADLARGRSSVQVIQAKPAYFEHANLYELAPLR